MLLENAKVYYFVVERGLISGKESDSTDHHFVSWNGIFFSYLILPWPFKPPQLIHKI